MDAERDWETSVENTFHLDAAAWDASTSAIDAKPNPNQYLISLMAREPQWLTSEDK